MVQTQMAIIISTGYNEDFDANDPDITSRRKRWTYWETLKKLRQEYMEFNNYDSSVPFESKDFLAYIEKTYGFRPIVTHFDIDGDMLTDQFEIIDEKLYVLFLLKWG